MKNISSWPGAIVRPATIFSLRRPKSGRRLLGACRTVFSVTMSVIDEATTSYLIGALGPYRPLVGNAA